MTKLWLTEVKPAGLVKPAAEAGLAGDTHVHRRVTLHRPGERPVGLGARLVEQPPGEEAPEHQRDADDHQRAADELGQGELPAEQQGQDQPEFDDEVRAGELERDRGGEVGALAKQRAGQGDGGVGARRRRGAQAGRDGEAARGVVGQQSHDRRLAHERLDRGREGEAEDQRPGDLPGHRSGAGERVDERVTPASCCPHARRRYPRGVSDRRCGRPRAAAPASRRTGPARSRSRRGRRRSTSG